MDKLQKAFELGKIVQQIESLGKYHEDGKDHWIEYSNIEEKKKTELENRIGNIICLDGEIPDEELEDLIPYPIQWI